MQAWSAADATAAIGAVGVVSPLAAGAMMLEERSGEVGVECLATIDARAAGAISAEANPAPTVQSSAATASISGHFMPVASRRWAQLIRLMAISREIFREISGLLSAVILAAIGRSTPVSG
ncbi:MAG: hypothetical protein ABR615_02380 [Pseudonocardiaceae bacterium]